MSIEIEAVRGPLDDEQLRRIADLYGVVDAKYASLEFLRHQFVDNPFGWSAHVFVLDDGSTVGHCSAIPFCARRGDETLVAGKIEAVVVDAHHRGRRPDGRNLAGEMLSTLYPFGLDCGMDGLFGLAPPHVARVHVRAGCHEVPADAPAHTLLTHASAYLRGEASGKRRLAIGALATGQATVTAAGALVSRVVSRAGPHLLEPPSPTDVELAAADPTAGAWTVSGADAWDWYVESRTLETLDIPGPNGCRALVRVPRNGAAPAQIVAWKPRRPGRLLPGVVLLATATRIARERGAPTLRFQPWAGAGGDGTLARACGLLGFVSRPEAALVVFSRDPRFDNLRVTPFFYVTF
jgi:hypothetical protein